MSDEHQPDPRQPELRPDRPAAMTDAELGDVIASLNGDDLEPSPPPSGIWARIETAIGDSKADVSSTAGATAAIGSSAGRPHADATAPDATAPDANGSGWRGRARSPLGWLAAAAVLALVVAGAVLALNRRSDARVVATADLEHEDGFDAAGASASASARLLERDGRYEIDLSDPNLPKELGEPADLELWLIEARADGSLDVQPVGIITDADGTISVPAGLDPRTHNIVDISIEPRDGDATHSGRSILRGPLVET